MPLPEAGLGQVKLEVHAKPVDTYSRPAPPAPGLGQQLAEAVKELNPLVKEYLEKRYGKAADSQKRADEARARQALLKAGPEQIEAVRNGTAFAQESEWFKKVYYDGIGRGMASSAVADLHNGYTAGGYATDTSPDADAKFESYLAQWRQNFGANLSADAANGAEPEISAAIIKLRAERQRTVNDAFIQGVADNTSNEINGAIDLEYVNARREGRAPDYAQVALRMNGLKDRLSTLKVLPRGEASKLVRESIIANAKTNLDLDLIQAMEHTTWKDPVTGAEVPGPFSGAEGRKAYLEAIQTIRSTRLSLEGQLFEKAERERKERVATVTNELSVAVLGGKRLSASQEVILAREYGDEAVKNYYELIGRQRARILGDRSTRDYDPPALVGKWLKKLAEGTFTQQDLTDALAESNDARNMQLLFDDATSRFRHDGRGSFDRIAAKDGTLRSMLADISKYGAPDGPFSKYRENKGTTIEDARIDAGKTIFEYVRDNPNIENWSRQQIVELQTQLRDRRAYWEEHLAAGETDATAAGADTKKAAGADTKKTDLAPFPSIPVE